MEIIQFGIFVTHEVISGAAPSLRKVPLGKQVIPFC